MRRKPYSKNSLVVFAIKKIILAIAGLLFVLVSAGQPVISGFSPLSGGTGTSVTINGSNFSPTPSSNVVYFGSVRADVVSATSTTLTVTAPPGVSFQPITVTVNSLTASSSQPFILTFPGGQNSFVPSSFGLREEYESGAATVFIAGGDLDNDGKADLVSVNRNANSISVRRNSSIQGIFFLNPKIDYTVGNTPTHVNFTDVEGNGKLDLIVTNSGSSSISLFRNTSTSQGNISFAARQDVNTIAAPDQIATADLDRDGKPEIIINSESSNTVRILPNTSTPGNFSFGTGMSLSPGAQPIALAVGDIDGDGKTDLAVARTASMITLFRNTSIPGTISFDPPSDVPVGGGTLKAILINDLDQDNKPEIITVANNTNQVSVFKNNSISGTFSFGSVQHFATGDSPYHVAIHELNGDGKPDLATANFAANTVSVLKNTSSVAGISFAGKVDYSIGTGPSALYLGDIEMRGEPDIVTANSSSNDISYLRNRVSEPTIFSFSPAAAQSGGTVTINGINLTGTLMVTFGNTNASSFNVVSDGVITAVVGTGSSGSVAVLTSYGGHSLPGFSYVSQTAPVISSFLPTSGATGTLITITGTDFSGASAVSFGGVTASSFTVNSPTSITAIVSAGATGSVSVTTLAGTGSLAGFTYIPPPTITSFTPTTASAGTNITITGTNFAGATAVSFGGVAATSFVVNSSTSITAVAGAGASGSVSVTTPGGTVSAPGFIYIPPPTITSFTPTSAAAGTTVTITGTNFTGATAVSFGGVAATSFTINSSTNITAVVGAGASGSVSVTTPGGTASLAGFVFTFPTGINDPVNNSRDLVAFPNPSDDRVIIKHPVGIKNPQIRLLDMTGRQIKLITPARNSNQTEMSVEELSAGVYQIIWTDGIIMLGRTLMIK